MTRPTLKLEYQPHPAQREVHEAMLTHRFVALAAGRRFGKSILALMESLRTALASPGAAVIFVSPVFAQARARYREFLKILRGIDHRYVVSTSKTTLRVELANDSAITFASAFDADRLRGEGYDLAVLDEAGYISQDVYDEVIRPALADRQGRLLAIGTPKGKGQLLYNLWVRGQSDDTNWASLRFSTWENPIIPESEKAEIEGGFPRDVLLQEFEAYFHNASAGAIPHVERCLRGTPLSPCAGHQYILGVDLAKKADFTALILLDAGTREVVHFERIQGVDYVTQVGRILRLSRQYNDAGIVLDQTGVGEAVLDLLRASLGRPIAGTTIARRGGLRSRAPRVTGVVFTNTLKQDFIDRLRLEIERGRIGIPAEYVTLIQELENFTYEMLPSGRVRYAAPSGFHDDTVIALALAVHALPRAGISLDHVDSRWVGLIDQLRPSIHAAERYGLARQRGFADMNGLPGNLTPLSPQQDCHLEFRFLTVTHKAGLISDDERDFLGDDIRRRALGTRFEHMPYSDPLDVELGSWRNFIRGEAPHLTQET